MRNCTCKLGNPPRSTRTKIAECLRHGCFDYEVVNNVEAHPYGLDLPGSKALYPDTPELDRVSAT